MKVVNKKIKVVIIAVLMLIGFASTYMAYKTYMKKDNSLDEVKLKTNSDDSMFAIMLDQGDGTYEESSSNHWPESGYIYNENKSGCIDKNGNGLEGALSYDASTKIATLKTNTVAYCYLYFDKINGDVYVSVSTDGKAGVAPSASNYTKSTSCTNGTSEWNNRYNRLEIGSLNGNQVVCNLAYTKDTSTKTLLIDEVESVNTTNNNGYRYSGKQPDNWIWFNNEMWRIIGSIPVTLSDGTTSNLVKIIRSEFFGVLAFDGEARGYSAAWGTNTLYDLLNNYYYGKKDATGASPCYTYSNTKLGVCNYTEDGISSEETDYYGRMIKDVYWNIGTVSDTSTVISTAYTTESGTKSTVTGKIGLMSASDYGYATSGITYSSIGLSSLSSYEQNNWIHRGSEWVLTPKSTNAVLIGSSSGSVSSGSASYDYDVRPVVYLDSTVYIVSGEGAINNPYIIGMN